VVNRQLKGDGSIGNGGINEDFFSCPVIGIFDRGYRQLILIGAYAARRGVMSGMDNTYGSTKGKRCSGGSCVPVQGAGAAKKKSAN